MSYQRFIYADMWSDEDFEKLDDQAKLLFVGLITTADDFGRLKSHAGFIRGAVFPTADLTLDQIRAVLDRVLAACRHVIEYQVDGQKYLWLENWNKYQHPKYRKKSLIPEYKPTYRISGPNPPGTRPESGPIQDGIRSRGDVVRCACSDQEMLKTCSDVKGPETIKKSSLTPEPDPNTPWGKKAINSAKSCIKAVP